MQQCLMKRKEQVLRFRNQTGTSSIGQAISFEEVNDGLYHELAQNASHLLNDTLIKCNKTEFLTVKA